MDLINSLAKKLLNLRFQKLVKEGLLARDVVPVQTLSEKKERLALLCESKKQVYAVICVNTKKTDNTTHLFTLLGHYLQAKRGVVLNNKQDWVFLSGHYEGLRAPLVVAEDVSARSWANHAS
ncbi:MAG: hypothetical protein H9W82_12005 [Lactobacillus sp.]|nr:hypothetical protein [Lactobacillus sp.]